MKKFLKPTLWKIIIFIIILIAVGFLSIFLSTPILNYLSSGCADCYSPSYGLPLPVFIEPIFGFASFSIIGLIIDLIFWYLIAVGIVALVEKIKRK